MLKELIKSKPKVNARMRQAMNIFNTVSRNRKYAGQYAAPLPLTEIDVVSHIDLHGNECFESDILINIILALDNEYLKLESAKRKAEANRG